jgi:hypothetical protein
VKPYVAWRTHGSVSEKWRRGVRNPRLKPATLTVRFFVVFLRLSFVGHPVPVDNEVWMGETPLCGRLGSWV